MRHIKQNYQLCNTAKNWLNSGQFRLKTFYAAGLLLILLLLAAIPAGAAFLSFVEIKKDNVGGVDGLFFANGIVVSPDGNQLYVTGSLDDAIAVFSRNISTGALTPIEVKKDGLNGVDGLDFASGVAISPDGGHIYVAGDGDDAVAAFSRNPTTGALTFVEVEKDGINGVDGLDGAWSVTVSPDGLHVYVVSDTDHAVAAFSRNVTTGALTFVEIKKDGVGGVDGLLFATGVAVSPDGAHVYAAGAADSAIAVFSRNSTTGALTFVEVKKDGVGGVDGLSSAKAVALSPDGAHVYAAGTNDDAVVVFSRNPTTGALTFVEVEKDGVNGVDGLDGATMAGVSSSGRYVYAVSDSDNAIVAFERDQATGALTFIEAHKDGTGVIDGLDNALRVAISPDEEHIYVTGAVDSAVAVFDAAIPQATTYLPIVLK